MPQLEANWPTLCAIALVLGLQHGIEADHLAVIDGLTRRCLHQGRGFARWCGALFALGHGFVVVTVALTAKQFSQYVAMPHWLEVGGSLFSIGVLTVLGVANLGAALRQPQGAAQAVARRLRWLRARRPATVALVGALFAISFDTISQAAAFTLAVGRSGGLGHAACLALLFTGGMLLADGLGGLWIARLITRADGLAPLSSQVMTGSLAALSLLVAAIGAARMVMPPTDSAGFGLAFGALVAALSGISYLAALWIARARPQGR